MKFIVNLQQEDGADGEGGGGRPDRVQARHDHQGE